MKSLSTRRHAARLLAVAATLTATLLPSLAQAQAYPDKPIRIVMPWGDGFPANSTRLFANALGERLKQSVVVDVRPGAGGEVAHKQIAAAPADGYTLLATGSSITIRSVIDEKNVDGLRDLQPIGQLVTTPYVIVAKAGKFGSFGGYLAAARAAPGKLNFASAGVGTGMHYLGELINGKAAIQTVHVPYASGARQLQAVLAGDVDVAIISLVTAWPQIRSGTLEALAVSSTQRSKVAPAIPTLGESGVKDIPAMGAWIALFGPKHLEAHALRTLSERVREIAEDPTVQATVASWGAELPDAGPAALTGVIRAEKTSWQALLASGKVQTAL